jgi:septum formation protein
VTHPSLEIILASASPRRSELLRNLGLPFRVLASDVNETVAPDLTPAEVVTELSQRKALAVANTLGKGIVIGSDTIVVLDDQILGKPTDEKDAFRMLQGLQGRIHEVYSAVTCIDAATGQMVTGYRSTTVRFKPLGSDVMERYIATGEPMDKAGSYAIQGLGAIFVEGIDGDYFNVVGLPLSLLAEQLKQFHIQVL